jgi:hypothetical protein
VPDKKLSETHIDHVNERLTAGIETCRSVVANYKSLLTGDPATAEPDAEPEIAGSPIAE